MMVDELKGVGPENYWIKLISFQNIFLDW